MMDLYKLHKRPKDLDLHDEVDTKFPKVFWDKYKDNPAELKKREAAIAKDPGCAYQYARKIIKGRWPEGEAAMAKHPTYAYRYARDVIKGRWPEGEAAMAKDPLAAYWYARDIINGRWPEGEAAIAKDPSCAYLYAKYEVKL